MACTRCYLLLAQQGNIERFISGLIHPSLLACKRGIDCHGGSDKDDAASICGDQDGDDRRPPRIVTSSTSSLAWWTQWPLPTLADKIPCPIAGFAINNFIFHPTYHPHLKLFHLYWIEVAENLVPLIMLSICLCVFRDIVHHIFAISWQDVYKV